jgi:UDP-glucose 4-epimerase
MKILISGTSGNLGLHITKQVLKDPSNQVVGLDRNNWSMINEINQGDVDMVIHTAYDLKNHINKTPDLVLDSNIQTTAKLLRLCHEKKISKFIFISSCSVYGESSNSTEEIPCRPITLNGHTKYFNEELIKTFCLENKISYLILRVFNSYGGNDHFSVIQKLIAAAKNKQPFILFNNGSAERDFIHINDVAQITYQLSTSNLTNDVINVGSGNSVRIIDLVKAIEKKYGPITIKHSENIHETIYSRANIKKLQKILNFQFTNVVEYINNL